MKYIILKYPIIFCLGILFCTIHVKQIYCQIPIATVKNYYPYSIGSYVFYGKGIGLYKINENSIDFYLIPSGIILENGTDIVFDVFEKARKVWNDENFGITINNAGFAQASDVLGTTKNKNLFGIGDNITTIEDKDYGAAKPYYSKFVTAGRYDYRILNNVHVELSLRYINEGKLIFGTPAKDSIENIYSTAVHELGHVLGLGDDIADASSIMSSHYNGKQPFSPVLGITDRKLIRALYPRIAPGRENETCLPR